MNYKTILRISDVLTAIEDWKRGLINEWQLLEALRKGYSELAAEVEPKEIKAEEVK